MGQTVSLLSNPGKLWTAGTWSKSKIQDLTGWTMLVTGGYEGVGYESAKAFAEKNAHVIIVGRNSDKGERAVQSIRKTAGPKARVEFMLCDLNSFRSIRAFAEAYRKTGYPISVLLNNAAIQAPHGERGSKTEDGFEVTLATNHFGPTYLTLLLLDVVKRSAPSRIVWVTSLGSQLVNPPYFGAKTNTWGIDYINWDDLKGQSFKDSDWWMYARTKLMNIMMTKEMARRLVGTGVEVFVAHPGLSVTDHFGKADTEHKLSSRLVEFYANFPLTGQSAERGAIALEFACTAPQLKGRSGDYVGSPELFPINMFQAQTQTPNAPLANDSLACARLYNETVKIICELDPSVTAATEALAAGTGSKMQSTNGVKER